MRPEKAKGNLAQRWWNIWKSQREKAHIKKVKGKHSLAIATIACSQDIAQQIVRNPSEKEQGKEFDH